MRIGRRSFPHPVLGNSDDVPDYAFQMTLEEAQVSPDRVVIDVSAVQCSCPTIQRAILKGAATYAVHVECGRTMFRRSYPFAAVPYRVEVPATDLDGTVELTAFVLATKANRRYRVDGANPAYDDTTFAIRPGDVLAVDTFDPIYLDRYNPVPNIGSVVMIESSSRPEGEPADLHFDVDKIRVRLPESDHRAYIGLRGQPQVRRLVAAMLVLPALVEAVRRLRDQEEDYSGHRWAEIINRRIEAEELGDEEPFRVAQRLWGSPVHQAFTDAQTVPDVTD